MNQFNQSNQNPNFDPYSGMFNMGMGMPQMGQFGGFPYPNMMDPSNIFKSNFS